MKNIDTRLGDGVQEEVIEPSRYCSRCAFLPNDVGESFRLVIDFTGVIRMINRHVMPFRASKAILDSLERK